MEWGAVHADVLEALGESSEVMPEAPSFFADQISLAVWAAQSELSLEALPATMNFPTPHVSIHPSSAPSEDPLILHYHDAVDDDGFLLRPSHRRLPRKPTPSTSPAPHAPGFRIGDCIPRRYLVEC